MTHQWLRSLGMGLVLMLNGFSDAKSGVVMNGFDVEDGLIATGQIFSGGPPRDGIPSIDEPKFIHANEANKLAPMDRVLGVEIKGESRAYPINILNWHEIVNDRIKGVPIVVTFCPLCGTGSVFSAHINGKARSFGVSGLLYNSDLLLYDRESESLWSQVLGQAVTGQLKGAKLEVIPVEHTSWAQWRSQHPDTLVLSEQTGSTRNYGRDPYEGYEQSKQLYFSVSHRSPPPYHPKERVLGIEINGVYKAYPFVELNRNQKTRFEDQVGGETITIEWQPQALSGRILDATGKLLPSLQAFWFAWYTFHPETELFRVGQL